METTITDYPLIKDGTINPIIPVQLLRHYANNHHHVFPIFPINVLRPAHILETIRNESFLLTAILAVTPKDRPDLAILHKSI
ncbi:hypothetical protein FZEAL_7838 [Fusarium zealandicum]|uniref:Uncharacterized protein n=1 Tax=Fusarium zealandicum TaxID=1053134 RepID=A0A8H4UEZ6_9HYPO|nr:hypothetical protein FZEAL_7838 [Fusarium zealandicum]